MKVSRLTALRRTLRLADPLPTLIVGYLFGLITAAGAVRSDFVGVSVALTARSPLPALNAMLACELPIVLAALFAGTTRFPILCKVPVFYRSLLWGFGSLCFYLSAGQSLLYFRYVLATGATLLPLCCLARLSSELASASQTPAGPRLFDHFGRCLFYLGLILLTLPLRL
ncbi:MAG: hypothetical protein IJX76_00825 [Clostridia bacterium]|nr:hypothetical protein [Clostridia bacterium]